MFLVTSTYAAAPEAIAAALPAHRLWVEALYDRGVFVLSGRLVPPTGGFMLARGVARDELEAILATDPFRERNLLDHAIQELQPTRWAPALATLGAPS
jgi:uncharacterized protein YciI